MRQAKLGAAVCAAHLLAASGASANNIKVSSVSLTKNAGSSTATVQLSLSWENSWRVTGGPANWDAAWVFVKYHTGDLLWKTATLDVSDAAHVVPANAALDVGVNGTRGMGAFVYRAAPGSGDVNFTNIRLKWNYGDDLVSDSALVTLDVHAVEMVYVPQGAFQLGDGVARTGAADVATFVAGGAAPAPFTVNTAGPINVGTAAGSLSHAGQTNGTYRAVPATFPTGFNAFYLMKYEASQHQWASFINTTSKLPATLFYTYFENTSNIVQNPDQLEPINGRQDFFSLDQSPHINGYYVYPVTSGVPIPQVPTRPIVQAKFPDRAFVNSVGAPVTIGATTAAASLNVTVVAPATTALLTVGQPVTSANIPRGAFVASITSPTVFVLGGITAASVTAGVNAPTSLASAPEETTLAYLDWSGLRPMTEFEYEKAARGPVPAVQGEYAWGTADIALFTYGTPSAGHSTLQADGTPDERPAENYNTQGGNAWTRPNQLNLVAGVPAPVPILGPARVGMFAKESYGAGEAPPRIQSGGGYYGAMDLTGNAPEMVARWTFPLTSSTAPNFSAEHGDGALAPTGLHNVTGWNSTTAPITTFYALRGGGFADQPTPVSQRVPLTFGAGIRGARTAPAQ